MYPSIKRMSPLVDFVATLFSLTVVVLLIYKYRHPVSCSVDSMIEKLRSDLIKLDNRASRLQFFTAKESYTEDKEKIFLCLQDKKTGDYYPYNQLIEVAIHELAHANTEVIDPNHSSPEWNSEFKRLLNKAIELGIYNPSIPPVSDYCPH
jgi:hypothetical protein